MLERANDPRPESSEPRVPGRLIRRKPDSGNACQIDNVCQNDISQPQLLCAIFGFQRKLNPQFKTLGQNLRQ